MNFIRSDFKFIIQFIVLIYVSGYRSFLAEPVSDNGKWV